MAPLRALDRSPDVRAYLPLVLEALERVDAELRRLHRSFRSVVAWPESADQEAPNVHGALRRAFGITREMRARVLDRQYGAEATRVREESLRARTIVVAMQLSELEQVANPRASREPKDRFAGEVAAFHAHVIRHVGVVNARWSLAIRQLAARDEQGVARLLDVAEAEFVELGRDPEVLRFLARGVVHEHQVVVSSCRVLAALFEVQVDRLEVPVLPSLKRTREAR